MKNKSKLINSVNEMMENRRGNCAQCIFATFGPYITNDKLDYDSCMKITAIFGGGINLTGNVCGAVSGALMSLGLKSNGNMIEAGENSSHFIEEFKKINGSIICRELIGFNFLDSEDVDEKEQEEMVKKCIKYVFDAASILENTIDDQLNTEDK